MTDIGARLRDSALSLFYASEAPSRLASHRMLEAADLLDKQHQRIKALTEALRNVVEASRGYYCDGAIERELQAADAALAAVGEET